MHMAALLTCLRSGSQTKELDTEIGWSDPHRTCKISLIGDPVACSPPERGPWANNSLPWKDGEVPRLPKENYSQ